MQLCAEGCWVDCDFRELAHMFRHAFTQFFSEVFLGFAFEFFEFHFFAWFLFGSEDEVVAELGFDGVA